MAEAANGIASEDEACNGCLSECDGGQRCGQSGSSAGPVQRPGYSAGGDAWTYVTHDMARSYGYRWGEDGLAAVCDRRQGLCLGLALILSVSIITGIVAGAFILFPNNLYPSIRASLPLTNLLPFIVVTATPTDQPVTTAAVFTPTAQPTATFTEVPTSTPVLPTATAVQASIGGGPGEIAFTSDRSGIPQIYLSDLAGSSVKLVTNMAEGACQPAWSPNGAQLAFVSPCKRPTDISEPLLQDTVIYISNADGSELTALPTVPGGDSEPAWSPDGKRIAFTSIRDGQPLIYVMNLVDQSVIRLIEPSLDFDSARQPSWSPVGNQLLFAKKRAGAFQIWSVTDAGQGEQQIVRSGQEYWDYYPIWSPDGKIISFTERNADGPVLPWPMSIPYEARDTASAKSVTAPPRPVSNVHYSPDGKWFVFEGLSPDNNLDIFYATVTGDQRTRLTKDPGKDFDPAWRP